MTASTDPKANTMWGGRFASGPDAIMTAINASIVLISLPAIFRGIHLNPLEPGNVSYLLWTMLIWGGGALWAAGLFCSI